jgi:MFS transporter, PHS family, inorganic phosphate transporter
VSEDIFSQDGMSSYEIVTSDATFGLIIAAIALPGYVFATVFIDTIGHWNLQAIGFVMMTLAYLTMALVVQFDCKVVWVNLTVFGLTFFFTTFGPNTTTFLIPSEIYPRAVRATCHGISAALGKIGAIIGTAGFPPAMDKVGLNGIMYICTGITAAGFLVTVLLLSKPLVDSAAKRRREPYAAGACLETTHAHPVSPGDAALVLSRSMSSITPIPCNP